MITRTQLHHFIFQEMNIDPAGCDDDGTAIDIAEIGLTRDEFEDNMTMFMLDNNVDLNFDDVTYRTDNMDDSGLEILIVRVPYA